MESIALIAKELQLKQSQIEHVLSLLGDGNTVPFIARYRKEATGGLDEEQIREIAKIHEYREQLNKRKADVIRLIDEKGMLTDELRAQIEKCERLVDVEDLYLPYKEKRKTKATEAIAMGLQPLAEWLMAQPKTDIVAEASKYVGDKVADVEAALQGARYIIAEIISDTAAFRQFIRNYTFKHGVLHTKLKKGGNEKDEKLVYQQYYDYQEPIRSAANHRILAINRAENENIIRVSLVVDTMRIFDYLEEKLQVNRSLAKEQLTLSIQDSYKRLLAPSIERELRNEATAKAHEEAIQLFGANLRQLLLQPPLRNQIVLALDPAFRTGCKLAVIDATGKLLEKTVIYPHQPKNDKAGSAKRIAELVKKHGCTIIAIGNGTASRESEEFIAATIPEHKLNIPFIIVSEAGASVYSASKLAIAEFPDLAVEERSAISIGRRIQDPLAELVKIEPQAIGVGQYQHDVAGNRLTQELGDVVETAVNQVGVNVNTASTSLLQYVSGLSKTIAQNIVAARETNGAFESRKQLAKIPRFGAKTYEQAIGFLRISDAKNPFDATAIHPESYKKAEELLQIIELPVTSIGTDEMKTKVESLNRPQLCEQLAIDSYTLDDILDAFCMPNRDIRDTFAQPLLRKDVLGLEDLFVGMELEGTVRNIVDFGAFVDIGLKNDGLVHISKMAKQFIKHPLDVVAVGDIVKVYVENIDQARGKVGLSMLDPE